jgi:ubiquinone/menaquinone biosynthesis C-methylase UbiE
MAKDLFSTHAADYAKFRPTYPVELIEYIASLAEKRDVALDCATGNGQAAILLANYFNKVFATDLSVQQISEAETHPLVQYSVSSAESTSFEDNTFDAITIAQAYHWVNHQKFGEEATRIGKNRAVVAVIGYNLFRSANPEVTRIVDDFYFNVTDPYWEPERKYVQNLYKDVLFPFTELPVTDSFRMETLWSIEQVEGYINTWSAIKKFIRLNNFNPVPDLMANIKRVWGMEARILFEFPLGLRIGRVKK